MKIITKYIALDNKEFTSEQECKDYEKELNIRIQKEFNEIEYVTHSPIIYSNDYSDSYWFNVKTTNELKTLHDWAILEFESHDSFVKNILNEELIGHWIFVEHNDYYIYLHGTLEEYKERAINFTIK